MIKVPEFILFDLLNKALAYLRNDYESQIDKENSFLHKILQGCQIERYNLWDQAIEVFINNDESNPRFLEVNMMFNMKREGLPTIHLTLPSEQTQTSGNGIGMDQGYQDDYIIDNEYNTDGSVLRVGSKAEVYTRRFQSTYNIVITSDNSNEVILIYHTIRSLLIALAQSISNTGLENMILGGQDVQLYQNMASKSMYMRAITVNLQYETSAPSIFPQNFVLDLTAKGKMVNK